MPDDDPPSDAAPQEPAETPAMAPGTLYDERHFIVGMAIDITEQQHAEETLRDSEDSVRRLIDAIPQIVWTNDVDGTARDSSTKDKIKGRIDEAKGKVKEKTGEATGDSDLRDRGTGEKAVGKIQRKIGDVEKVFGK
jgi:uncharacterized protein YjbJ (UPF0337 family)